MKFKELREKYKSKFKPAEITKAVDIALSMGGNMTGAYKRIEAFKKGLANDPMVKQALKLANESVNEETINELNFSYAFFDVKSLNTFMLKALKIKGLTVIDSEKQTGGHFTVRVKADDKKIITKANSVALKAMSEWVTESNDAWAKLSDTQKNKARQAYQKLSTQHDRAMDKHDIEVDKYNHGDKGSGFHKIDPLVDKIHDIEDKKELLLKKYGRGVSSNVNENYNQDLTLATKNIARLSNKESGQDKKDYQAVSRALAQGNLGAVKKVIKGISTKEIQSDLLGILVGYNDLIAKLYPKAVDSKGNLKSGLTVDKMIKEDGAYVSQNKMTDAQKQDLKDKQDRERQAQIKRMKIKQKDSKDDAERKQKDRARRLAKYAGKSEEVDSLDELTTKEKQLVNQMYDKKGNLTPLGKKVLNHNKKPGDKGYVENVEEGSFYGRDDLVKQFKTPKSQRKANVRLVRTSKGGTERATLNIKKNAKKIAQLKKDGYKVDPTYYTEETVLENYRTLAVKGMGAEDKRSIKVGREVDYYEPKNGDKRQGKVTKMTAKDYTVKDDKTGKTHTFVYHDRNDAKKLLRAYKHHESTAAWAKSLEKIKNQRQLDKISNKDKATLKSIMDLLNKEKK